MRISSPCRTRVPSSKKRNRDLWWQRRELWLFLLMAFLGILVGIVVYLKYMDGYEWPWSSSSDRGQTTPAEVVVTDGEEVPDGREIIAVYDFEDPTQVEVRLGDAAGEDTTSESLTPSQSSRREPTPRARPKQAGTQNQKQASKQRKTPDRPACRSGADRRRSHYLAGVPGSDCPDSLGRWSLRHRSVGGLSIGYRYSEAGRQDPGHLPTLLRS